MNLRDQITYTEGLAATVYELYSNVSATESLEFWMLLHRALSKHAERLTVQYNKEPDPIDTARKNIGGFFESIGRGIKP